MIIKLSNTSSLLLTLAKSHVTYTSTTWTWSNKWIGDDTKGTALRIPNCIRKTKNKFCRMHVSVPFPKFCEKLLPNAEFHWNWTISCWVMAKKRFSIWRLSAILNLKFSYVVTWLSWSSNQLPYIKFHQNWMIFCCDMAIWWFSRWWWPQFVTRKQSFTWTKVVARPDDLQPLTDSVVRLTFEPGSARLHSSPVTRPVWSNYQNCSLVTDFFEV